VRREVVPVGDPLVAAQEVRLIGRPLIALGLHPTGFPEPLVKVNDRQTRQLPKGT
jgi:hypothetical protein